MSDSNRPDRLVGKFIYKEGLTPVRLKYNEYALRYSFAYTYEWFTADEMEELFNIVDAEFIENLPEPPK